MAEHKDSSPPVKRTFGQKFKRSCARFWWVYLIVFIIIALVVVLPVIFVGYPNIARKVVKDSKLTITNQQFLNPTNETFKTVISTEIESSSPLTGVSAPFDAAISLGDGPTIYHLPIPQYTAQNGAKVTVTADNVKIENAEEFRKFSAAVFAQDTVTVKLKGDSTIKSGALQAVSVTYDQAIDVKTLNKLDGVIVNDIHLNPKNPPVQNVNVVAAVNYNNTSPLELQLGTIVYELAINGEKIGNATLQDFTLKTGNHAYPSYVYVDLIKLNGLISGNKKYNCGTVPMTFYNGVSTVDGKVVDYFTYALHQANTTTSVDLAPSIKEAGLGNAVLKGPCVN